MSRRCVVIGGGLGGLATAAVLAREGYEVHVLEQSQRVGGCLQCFTRGGSRFETGMHFVGSLDEGQVLRRYLDFLGIRERLRFDRLDPKRYDVVGLAGERFSFANGHEPMVEALVSRFPHEREGLQRFWTLADSVARSSPYYGDADREIPYRLFATPVDEVLESVIGSPMLRDVLMGNISLYAARRGATPFSTCAFIANFYNSSAFRIVGGSETVADALVESVVRNGGEVRTDSRVVRVRCKGGMATAVELADGGSVPADVVVCDVHPSQLKDFFADNELRPIYHSRIEAMANTTSAFSLFLKFKPKSLRYMNYNYYGFACRSPWDMAEYDEGSWPRGYLYMHHCHEPHPQYADSGVVLAYMSARELSQWRDTTTGRRGREYEEFKMRKAERLLEALERDFPGIGGHIEGCHTATPLTYRDYTLTPDGSMYGLERDVTRGIAGRVDYRTRVPNFLLVGQNVNAHGMLGVLVGVIKVCEHVLGAGVVARRMVEGVEAPQPGNNAQPSTLVVGGGLGGLLTGALLARKGHRVTVLERNGEVGGGLCTFERGGTTFPTGMHLFGGFQEGGPLRKLCSYLGIMDRLDLRHSSPECVDEVVVGAGGIRYRIPCGRAAFTEYFSRLYPSEADGIRRYVEAMYRLADEEDLFYLRDDRHDVMAHSEEFLWSTDRFLKHYISSPELRGVLAYTAPLYAGVGDETPAYVHALISILHIEGTTRFVRGGSQMAKALAEVIEEAGGCIRTHEEVVGFVVEDHRAVSVRTAQGCSYSADSYVSDLPTHTLLSVLPPGAFPRAFRQRLENAPDSYSAFKVYVRLRDSSIPYRDHPVFYASDSRAVWECADPHDEGWPRCAMIMMEPQPDRQEYAQTLTVVCPMAYSEVERWADTTTGRRSEEYRRWKEERIRRVMEVLEVLELGVGGCVERVEASSPLTIRDYLGNRRGSMFGLHKDCDNMMLTQLSVRTKVRNLFLTGQDVNLHGMCGVALTAIATAEAVLGDSGLRKEVRGMS